MKNASKMILKILPNNHTPNLKTLQFIQSTSETPEKQKQMLDLFFEEKNSDFSELKKLKFDKDELFERLFVPGISVNAFNNISKMLSFHTFTPKQYRMIICEIKNILKYLKIAMMVYKDLEYEEDDVSFLFY